MIDQIYVIHYTKLTERKKYLENKFSKLNVNVYWMDSFDREKISEEDTTEYYDSNSNVEYYIWNENLKYKKLRFVEVLVWMAHYQCYLDFLNHSDWSKILILEDDVVFENDAFEKLNDIVARMPSECDILEVGNGCGFEPKNYDPNVEFYDTDFGVKTTSSYILNRKAAEILKKNKKSVWPIDYHINVFKNEIKIMWYEPAIFKQGSQNGIYKTAVQLEDRIWEPYKI
jgi:GR25 family glycosyltransferase involved in LPS biosynthesis